MPSCPSAVRSAQRTAASSSSHSSASATTAPAGGGEMQGCRGAGLSEAVRQKTCTADVCPLTPAASSNCLVHPLTHPGAAPARQRPPGQTAAAPAATAPVPRGDRTRVPCACAPPRSSWPPEGCRAASFGRQLCSREDDGTMGGSRWETSTGSDTCRPLATAAHSGGLPAAAVASMYTADPAGTGGGLTRNSLGPLQVREPLSRGPRPPCADCGCTG